MFLLRSGKYTGHISLNNAVNDAFEEWMATE
jgi:hypothetical protein